MGFGVSLAIRAAGGKQDTFVWHNLRTVAVKHRHVVELAWQSKNFARL
jgi:hypothetical protein